MGEALAKSQGLENVQIICPIYNEGKNVQTLVRRLEQDGVQFNSLRFVYDKDDDTSLPYIAELRRENESISALKNTLGPGVVKALRFGFLSAVAGPVVVVMGDNSDKLSIIPQMVQLWRDGATVVCPSRYMPGGIQHGGPPFKTFLSRTAGKILRLCGFPSADATNNFKLYDGEWLARQQVESVGGFEIALELCYKAYQQGHRIVELPTEWYDREEGESRFKLWSWMPRYLRWYLPLLALTIQRRFGR